MTETLADTAPLREELRARLTPEAAAWLEGALHEVATAPATEAAARLPVWERHFVTAGRRCRAAPPTAKPGRSEVRVDGRESNPPARTPGKAGRIAQGDRPAGLTGAARHMVAEAAAGDCVDAVRVLLLQAAGVGVGDLDRVYTRGSADERRAVLLALPYLPGLGGDAVPLVQDALRANDTRLVAAAVGPYAAVHLDGHAWRQAVLKCLFTGVPLAAVACLAERARGDVELARMLTDYAAERTAAGRPVPDDLHRASALTQEIS